MKALITGRLTKAEFPDGTTALAGEIEVDCDLCGKGTVILPGHHLKAIRDLLIAWCDIEPTLTGDDEHRQKISEQSFRGRVPPDPTRN